MNIQQATMEDAKALCALVLAAADELRGVDFNQEGWERFVSVNTEAAFMQKLSADDFLIVTCVEFDHLLGFISLKDKEKIDQLFVHPAARHRGIASQLWQMAKQIALQEGATGAFWVRSSHMAIPVYTRFGFKIEGERQNFAGISFQLMRLTAT